jgi:hypothetical protein
MPVEFLSVEQAARYGRYRSCRPIEELSEQNEATAYWLKPLYHPLYLL